MLDTEELEYSLDLSSTNSDFEETQELKYSVDLFTNSSENTDSKLSSNMTTDQQLFLLIQI